MNYIKSLPIIGISIFIALSSCKKEANLDNQATNKTSFINGNLPSISSVSKVSYGEFTMLKFNSWQDFERMASDLQNLREIEEDDFYNINFIKGMTDDEYNNIVDDKGFDNERILESFENSVDFTNSYRKKLNGEVELWLANDELNFTNHPKNKTLFSGSELSLINDHQQIMIGDTIYQCLAAGYFAIGDDYEESLVEIKDAQTIGLTLNIDWWPNLKWWFINPPAECVLWKKEGQEDIFTSDYKTYRSCGIRSFTVYCKALAELESYKKKNNGGWKKYKRDLGVILQAAVTDNNCSSASQGGESKNKNRSELESNLNFWGNAPNGSSYRAQLGNSISGSFTYAGLNTVYTLQ